MQLTRLSLLIITTLAPLTLKAGGFTGGGAALVNVATKWVSQETGYPEASIAISALDRKIAIKPCEQTLNFRFPFQGNQRTVEASCEKPQWKRFIRVKIEKSLRAVGTAKSLNAGHSLTVSDLKFIPISPSTPGGFSDPEQLIGLTLKVTVDANTIIEPSMMVSETGIFLTNRTYEAGEIIKRDDLTRLEIESPDVDALTSWPVGIVTALGYTESKQMLLNSSVELSAEVVVSTTNIVRGQVIDEALVEVQLRPRKKLGAQTLSSLEEAIGLEATRTIRAGNPITISDLIAADLVRKGEKVTLTISRGALTISVDTIAVKDGKMGEQVELKNAESGKIIHGVVTGRHRAEGISP
jgi:flagella basal body P-ring formation protein FlgA